MATVTIIWESEIAWLFIAVGVSAWLVRVKFKFTQGRMLAPAAAPAETSKIIPAGMTDATAMTKIALFFTITGAFMFGSCLATLTDSVKRHFNEQAFIDLTALIAFQNMSSKFNSALHVPAQGFCRSLQPLR